MNAKIELLTFFEKLLNVKNLLEFKNLILLEINSYFNVKESYFLLLNSIFADELFSEGNEGFYVIENILGNNLVLDTLYDEGLIDWSINEQKIVFFPNELNENGGDNYIILPFGNSKSKIGVAIFLADYKMEQIDDKMEDSLSYISHISSLILQNIIFQKQEEINLKRQNSLINIGDKIFRLFNIDVIIDYMSKFLYDEFLISCLTIFKIDEFGECIDLYQKVNNRVKVFENEMLQEAKQYFFEQPKIFYNDSPLVNLISKYEDVKSVLTIKKSLFSDDVYLLLMFKKDYNLSNDQFSLLKIVLEYFFTSLENAMLFIHNKKSKELIELNQKELFKASKMVAVGDLASSIAHEINTPLQVILGRMELLILKSTDKSLVNDVRIIKEETERMIGLVKELLDLATAKYDKQKFEKLNIVKVVEGVISFIDKQFETDGISIIEKGFDKDVTIFGSEALLKQVFLNILMNSKQALKYFDREEKFVKIELLDENDYIVIKIKDNGPGIPQEIKESLFENYVTLKQSGQEGHGIGLSIVKNFIEKHRGTIVVDSVQDQYTEFIIKLPINK